MSRVSASAAQTMTSPLFARLVVFALPYNIQYIFTNDRHCEEFARDMTHSAHSGQPFVNLIAPNYDARLIWTSRERQTANWLAHTFIDSD